MLNDAIGKKYTPSDNKKYFKKVFFTPLSKNKPYNGLDLLDLLQIKV
jgi:hypothetical protein